MAPEPDAVGSEPVTVPATVTRENLQLTALESARRDQEAIARMAERREDFYRTILESLSEGVLITNEESRVLFANRQVEALTGWSPGELAGRVSYEVLAPREVWPAMQERLKARLSGAEETYENELVCKDGTHHWIQVRGMPLREADGRIVGTIGILRCLEREKALERENDRLRHALSESWEFPDIVGKSPALRTVLEQVRMVAPTEAAVLILGESGTGKELVARAIHEASQRRAQPMVRVNCASIPRELFESEFFGHVKGAFTGAVRDRTGRFEVADGGTLFLDEVGEIPGELQAKLLRVLQEGTFERVGEDRTRRVNVRIVAASNRDLLGEARTGRFRLDLYYRLAVFPIELPPLRDRIEDIQPLAQHFLARAAGPSARRPRLGAAQVARLESYDWPGNVRELQNVIERAVIVARGGDLQFDGLLPSRDRVTVRIRAEDSADSIESLASIREREREVVRQALAAAKGRIYGPGGAAARLGVPPTTLSSKLRRWGLRGGHAR